MSRRDRLVIITGDDFGLSVENNRGIITAHRHGILSTTSLMIGGDAASDAVDLARQYPSLAVGLHVNLSDTRPILPPEQVFTLVQSDGRFPADDDATHRAALWSVTGRQQIRAEIAAQFRAFHATGLKFDHVNSHRHILKHPLLAWMLFAEASRWQVRETRIPWPSEQAPNDPMRYLRAVLLRWLGAIHGVQAPDRSIGRSWTNLQLANLLMTLPRGRTELYFHPVDAPQHQFAADLPILLDDSVKGAIQAHKIVSYTSVGLM